VANDRGEEINHPPHYSFSAVEPIDAIRTWGLGFALGNCIKYIARAGRGGSPFITDLKKARWYLDSEIAYREGQSGK